MSKGLAIVALALVMQSGVGTPFRPWEDARFRIVNAIEFLPGGETMLVSLFPVDVAKVQGVELPPGSPEVALYESRLEAGRWSAPRLLPFAGVEKDYEAAVSPDGSFIIFNSQRPLPDGSRAAAGKNNLWLSRRSASGWSPPRYLSSINRPETEESYASIAADGTIVYVREAAADAQGPDFDIHVTRLTETGSGSKSLAVATGSTSADDVEASRPFAPAATSAGESDPWIAPDGSYVIFTRWDRSKKWEEDCDLYITFRTGREWSTARPLAELNSANAAEYAVSIFGTPPTVYWKSRGTTLHAPWEPIIAAARKRSSEPVNR
jgi:hypothetical protein